MSIIIATWNTQGDPTPVKKNDAKQKTRNSMLAYLISNVHVLLLQECGNLAEIESYTKKKNANISYGQQAGAYNVRCSTAIVSFVDCEFESKYLTSGTGRSAIFMFSNKIAIGTLHSQSGAGAGDVSTVVTHLFKKKINGFIIGGDFNCAPSDTGWIVEEKRNTMYIGTQSRGSEFSYWAPQNKTHVNGGILDWFIFNNVIPTQAQRCHAMGGDHYPVMLEIR